MNNPIKTSIPARERLIFALDVPDLDQAKKLVATLDDSVMFYKLGLEFFLSGNYFELAAELKERGKKIFADLKLFDIPATVAAAVRQLARHEVNFCTVHGNDGMLRAAVEAKGEMQMTSVSNAMPAHWSCPAHAEPWSWVVMAWSHPDWKYPPCANPSITP